MRQKRFTALLIGLFMILLVPLMTTTAQGGDGTCFSAAPANHLVPRLAIGMQGRVVASSSPVGLFDESNVLAEIPAGGVFQVVDGPHCDETYVWWMVNYNGLIGWAAEGDNVQFAYFLEPISQSSPCISNTTYTVVSGDTLFSIAQRFGTTVDAIVAASGVTNAQTIFAGQQLIIPCGTNTVAPTTPFVFPNDLTPISAEMAVGVGQMYSREVDFSLELGVYEGPRQGVLTAAILTDSSIALYSMTSPDETPGLLAGDGAGIYAIATSPDGQLAFAEHDPTMTSTTVEVSGGLFNNGPVTVSIPVPGIEDFAVSSSLLATTSGVVMGPNDGVQIGVHLWTLTGAVGTEVAFIPHDSVVTNVVFNHDGTRLATLSLDGEARVYDVTQTPPTLMATFDGGDGSVNTYPTSGNAMTFSPDSRLLAIGGSDGAVRFWDISNQRLDSLLQVLMAGSGELLSLAYSPDGTVLAAAGGFSPLIEGGPFPSQDNNIYLYDVSQPARAWEMLRAMLTGHTDVVTGLAFSPDGTLLTSISADNTWRIWGVQVQQEVALLEPTAMTIVPQPTVANPIASTGCSHTFFFGEGAGGECVTEPAASVSGVYQTFEGGGMLWRGDIPEIIVLYNDGSVQVFPDTWAGEPIITDAAPPAGRVTPERGFGWVWTQQPDVRDRLGWAFAGEQPYTMQWQAGVVDSPDPNPPSLEFYSLPDGRVVRVTFGDGVYWNYVS